MTLRFRLALVYTIIAFVLIATAGSLGVFLFTRALDGQFNSRLIDQAEYVAALVLPNPDVQPGEFRPSGGALIMVFDSTGREVTRSQSLGDLDPLIIDGHQELANGIGVRGLVQPIEMPGVSGLNVWIALPDDSLEKAKASAWQFLIAALAVAPALMLLVGWFVGRYFLRGLASAARVAERLDPSSGSIPLPERQDEVYRLLEAINRLLGRIETQKQSEKALLGQIVHELGAPLTVLKAYLASASTRTGDQEVRRAQLVAEEMTFTTQDLMQLARGQMDLTLALHYLSAASLRERLDRLVPDVVYSGDWNVMVLCDPDRLVQAVRNLLANARRAVGPDGHVELYLHEEAGEVRFHVRDDGPGLPEGLGESIFDPFVSGSGSSGLGLSVSRQIAQLHGGTLGGGNRPEGGAEFVLVIPSASTLDDEDPEVPQDQQAHEPQDRVAWQG
ncbi:HAMP domain-containing sensor histidine kinase [Deinococcus peraridilitoris]|uniref:histidine kinase n=1 Tax=Deinococcus peraridilitoris (strain DSM 19664 / LMG 22246 / CIP 109416 / KR-200) TaxID=937777 RepID=L0A2Y6_DEIPD|nr:HAMP domain-containing sensor histidine kinase [Deinococcus peraridilitoris]AFZ67809.1 signal transduction histidine kinase [Deinococcus peraridilitoris DSM 19664]